MIINYLLYWCLPSLIPVAYMIYDYGKFKGDDLLTAIFLVFFLGPFAYIVFIVAFYRTYLAGRASELMNRFVNHTFWERKDKKEVKADE